MPCRGKIDPPVAYAMINLFFMHFKLKKLDGFILHKYDGDCEITIKSGKRKYRARWSGNINFFKWNTEEITIPLADTEGISLKVSGCIDRDKEMDHIGIGNEGCSVLTIL